MALTELRTHSAGMEEKSAGKERGDFEIDLIELLYRLIERLKYILLAAVLGASLMGVWTQYFITPMYTATSKMYVLNSQDSALNLSDLQIGTYLAADYQEVFTNWHVHEMVIQRLGLHYSYSQLSQMVSVTNPSGTRILYIRVTSDDPDEAKVMADEYAKVAQEFIVTTMETRKPNIFEEALTPAAPSSPNKMMNVILGFCGGVLLACLIITIQFLTDDRIRTAEELEKYLKLTTLGVMPLQTRTAARGKRNRKSARKGEVSE